MFKKLSILFLLLILIGITGVSYAYWIQSETQNNFDTLKSKCFKLTMLKESEGITLEKAYPMTNEDGMKEEGYTFTIKNICNTMAYYQVNIEELELPEEAKALSEEYIKLSLNNSDGKLVTEYETVKETIENAIDSHKLTSGSLGPQEEKTYNVKLWMDYNTPAIEDVMHATYESKISVIASEIEEERLKNEIEIASRSENEGYRKDKDQIEITATSENYQIIEYSYDNKKFNSLSPNKNVTLEKEETVEGSYPVYFKDEVGNIKEGSYETSKLDQTPPTIEVEEESGEKGAILTIHLNDAKSGLSEYKIEDGVSALDLEENWQPLNGNTEDITYESTENKTIVIKVKDAVGNIKEEKHEITKVDTTGPSITVDNPHSDEWTSEDVILTITAEDDISGVDKFYYKKQSDEGWTEIEESNVTITEKNGSATVTINTNTNETYEFKATDKMGNTSEVKDTKVKVDKSAGSASFGIESETEGSNGWKKALTVKVTAEDNESDVSSAKYCIATGETCEPNQDANLSNGTFNVPLENNASAQKVCVTVTNGAGKESEILCDNNTYKVDGEGPTIKNPSAATEWGQTNRLEAKAEDTISGIGAYAFDKSSATSSTTSWTTDTTYPKTEQTYSGSADSNGDWYIHVRDQAGNISSTKIVVSKVDTSAATANYAIGNQTEGSNGWKKSLTIKVTVTDNESGISSAKYCTTTSSTCDPTSTASLSTGTTSKTFDVPFQNNASAQRVCVKITNGAGKESGVLCDNNTYKVDGQKPVIDGLEVYNNLLGNTPYTYTDYSADGGTSGTWNTSGRDPTIYFSNVTKYKNIKGAFVELENALGTDQMVQIFYSTNGTLSEGNSRRATLKAGSKYLFIELPNGNYQSIRFDIGETSGLSYKIKNLGILSDSVWINNNVTVREKLTETMSGIQMCQYKYAGTAYSTDTTGTIGTNEFVSSRFYTTVNTELTVRCYDNAGNISNEASTTVLVDRTAPTITDVTKLYRIFGNVKYNAYNYESDVGINGTWVTKTLDPQLSFSDVSHYVNIKGVYIELEEALSNNISVEIFYADKTLDYKQEKSVNGALLKGNKAIYLEIPTGNYASIRVDIGYEAGLRYKIKNIALASDTNIWNNNDISGMTLFSDDKSGFDFCEKSDNNTTFTKDTGIILGNRYITSAYTAASNKNVYLRCKDQAGNVSATKVYGINIDKSDATASYTIGSQTTGTNGWKKSLTIKVTATDNESGILSAKYCTTTSSTCTPASAASLSTGTTSKTFNVTFPNNANAQRVCVAVTNGAGKESGVSCDTNTYKVDGKAPVIGSISGSTVIGLGIKFTANNVTENESGIDTASTTYSYTLSNNTKQSSASNTVTFLRLDIGTLYTVTVTVKDKAGNVSEGKVSGQFQIAPLTAANTLIQYISRRTNSDGLFEIIPTLSGWNTKELRYVGASPDNYLLFNDEVRKWRIIGLVNVKTNNGIEQRVKIIRSSIGGLQWDSNNDNNWSNSSLMKLLNSGDYYNRVGTYASTGLTQTAKNMIDTGIIWNLGGTSIINDCHLGPFYERERGNIAYSNNPREWKTGNGITASVGLMYPSDYGYATIGGSSYNRDACLALELTKWNSNSDCYYGDWLYTGLFQWTLTPSEDANRVFALDPDGSVGEYGPHGNPNTPPVVYLKPTVKINGGNGTYSSPFTLSV